MTRVVAVVVTHDREALLRECLEALRAQSRPLDGILVVDNASTDGTAAMLRDEYAEDVEVLRLERNDGSAGGFHAGLDHALAAAEPADWLWAMDDDTIPTPTALEALLAAPEQLAAGGLPEPALLASRVLWTDGTLHPMNQPWPRWGDKALEVGAAERGLVAIRAISYVSILLSPAALHRSGLPRPGLFIWGDDIEFTARLLHDDVGYLVPGSVVHHRTVHADPSHHSTGTRYYFDVRNKVLMLRGDVWRTTESFWFAVLSFRQALEYLRRNGWARPQVGAVVRGIRDGLLRPPAGTTGPPPLPRGR